VYVNRTFWRDATIVGAADSAYLRTHLDVLVDAARYTRYRQQDDLPAHVVETAVSVAIAAGRRPVPGEDATGLDLAGYIATQPNLTGPQMSALVTRFRDRDLRRALVTHPSAPATLLSRLLRLDPSLRDQVAAHPNTSSALARRLWASHLDGWCPNRQDLITAWQRSSPAKVRRLGVLADANVTSAQAAALMWPLAASLTDPSVQFAIARRIDELPGFERTRALSRWVTSFTPDTDAATALALARCDADSTLLFTDAAAGLNPGRSCADAALDIGLIEQLCANHTNVGFPRSTEQAAFVAVLLDLQVDAVRQMLPVATGAMLEPFLARLAPSELARIVADTDRQLEDRLAATWHLARHLTQDEPDLAALVRSMLCDHPGELAASTELECWEAVAGIIGAHNVLDAPAQMLTSFRNRECQREVFDAMAGTGHTALIIELAQDFPGTISDVLAQVAASTA
jgi:hypothetical protein